MKWILFVFVFKWGLVDCAIGLVRAENLWPKYSYTRPRISGIMTNVTLNRRGRTSMLILSKEPVAFVDFFCGKKVWNRDPAWNCVRLHTLGQWMDTVKLFFVIKLVFDRNNFLLLWTFHMLSTVIVFLYVENSLWGTHPEIRVVCMDGVAIQIECYSRDPTTVIFDFHTDSSIFSEGKCITIHRPLSTVLCSVFLKKIHVVKSGRFLILKAEGWKQFYE